MAGSNSKNSQKSDKITQILQKQEFAGKENSVLLSRNKKTWKTTLRIVYLKLSQMSYSLQLSVFEMYGGVGKIFFEFFREVEFVVEAELGGGFFY